MQERGSRFLRSECGAVTPEYVLLMAAAVSLGLSVVVSVSPGTLSLAGKIGTSASQGTGQPSPAADTAFDAGENPSEPDPVQDRIGSGGGSGDSEAVPPNEFEGEAPNGGGDLTNDSGGGNPEDGNGNNGNGNNGNGNGNGRNDSGSGNAADGRGNADGNGQTDTGGNEDGAFTGGIPENPDFVIPAQTITAGWGATVTSGWLSLGGDLPVQGPVEFRVYGDGNPTLQAVGGRATEGTLSGPGTNIIIDAPRCGTSSTVVLQVGGKLGVWQVSRPEWPSGWGRPPATC